MTDDTHPLIALFESRAEVLDAAGQASQLDDAIVKLASWMALAQDRLTEDDMTAVSEIGAILYRDGLNRRMNDDNVRNLLRQLREIRAEYDAALIGCQRENAVLKVFCLSLLQAHPNPQAALARLANQAEELEGRALFGAWTDTEIEALRPVAQELFDEISQRLQQ